VPWKRFQTERADEETLRGWFGDTDNGNLGLGVVLGQVSGGLLVRDFDDSGGYGTLVRDFPKSAKFLPAVLSARGHHVWFRCRDYLPAGSNSFLQTYANGELRGDCHLIVVPPTIHPETGLPYRWLIEPGHTIPFVDLSSLGMQPRRIRTSRPRPMTRRWRISSEPGCG
jgi:hypothetical protein